MHPCMTKNTRSSTKNIEKVEAHKLWSLGVDSIFIDNPMAYTEILKSS